MAGLGHRSLETLNQAEPVEACRIRGAQLRKAERYRQHKDAAHWLEALAADKLFTELEEEFALLGEGWDDVVSRSLLSVSCSRHCRRRPALLHLLPLACCPPAVTHLLPAHLLLFACC